MSAINIISAGGNKRTTRCQGGGPKSKGLPLMQLVLC